MDAASAFKEKSQNASAWLGRSIVANAKIANTDIKICWLDLIGKQGNSVSLSYTKTAYISRFLHASVSADRSSIAEPD